MITFNFVVFCSQIIHVFTYSHLKPLEKDLWTRSCKPGTRVLNDCNWCVCDKTLKYVCKARACNEIDKFAHFNEAIDDIVAGMDGHGAWRSREDKCEPGVSYRRRDLLCLCGEDGNYAYPICSQIFKNLEEVVQTNLSRPLYSISCTIGKVYLMGCDVCVCHNGFIVRSFCTNRDCRYREKEDLLYEFLRTEGSEAQTWEDPLEVYAECEINALYRFGCQTCMCLRNNRLVCNKCSPQNSNSEPTTSSYCNEQTAGLVFKNKCNLCFCDANGFAYCTVKKCLENSKSFVRSRINVQDVHLELVSAPVDDQDCIVGTKYKKDCNTCVCVEYLNTKVFSCTLKGCHHSSKLMEVLHSDCVEDTEYEINCLICTCHSEDGIKREHCHVNPKCVGHSALPESRSEDLDSLHGYCEPLQLYKKDCNSCRCLSDGKTVSCTTNICQQGAKTRSYKEIDLVPVKQSLGSKCVDGNTYKVDCNICYCLANGDAVCTMVACKS